MCSATCVHTVAPSRGQALDLLVAVEAALALLRPGHDTLRVHDPGRWFRRVAPCLAHPPRQQSRHIRPDALGPEPVMPGANRLPGTEILRKRSPLAAGMFQVKAGIHHLPDVSGKGEAAGEQRGYGRPLPIRQVTRIPPSVIFVLLAIFGCPHADLPSRDINSRQESSVKQALSAISDDGPAGRAVASLAMTAAPPCRYSRQVRCGIVRYAAP